MVKTKVKKEKISAKKKSEPKKKTAKKVTKIALKPKPAPKPLAKRAAQKVKATVRPGRKVTAKEKEAALIKPHLPLPQEAAPPIEKVIPVKETPKPPAVTLRPPSITVPAKPPVVSQPEVAKKKIERVAEKVKEVVKEAQPSTPAVVISQKELQLSLPVTVKDLAVKLQEKPSILIKALMDMKIMSGINQLLDESVAGGLCEKFGFKIKKAPDEEEVALSIHEVADAQEELKLRPPIVTFMGHVDHGKTSLLDAIRKTKVAEYEHGGITQHIGAYRVVLPHNEITFLDTPGHEAFTAMRARGARATDIVVLVVAADDGVMPQTKEAIDHARAAEVSIIVAINKIDKPQADLDRVKKQLGEMNLTAEDWGGKTITVPVSAKTREGIDTLLEMIVLEAQMLELKANPSRLARGVVIEAKMSKGRGPVSTLLVGNGTLHLNDYVIAGKYYGKVKAMFDDHGRAVVSCGPSFPVEVLGIAGIPEAGEQFYVIPDEKTAREIALKRQERQRQEDIRTTSRITLEDLHAQILAGKLKELKLIIKADVQGSLEAIKDTLAKLDVTDIKLNIIHEGVGNINSSDVILAVASNALILGFNVVSDERAKELVAKEGVDVRIYNIIYELANDIKAAIEGMLEPRLKKNFLGKLEVRKVFKLSRSGTIAGCFVSKGKILRSSHVDVVRNGETVFEGKISSLKRFKDDVREAAEGYECGIAIGGFEEIKEGDIIEAYEIEKIARKLE
jgi:translation initiation factor IF-2